MKRFIEDRDFRECLGHVWLDPEVRISRVVLGGDYTCGDMREHRTKIIRCGFCDSEVTRTATRMV